MAESKKIRIECEGSESVPLDALVAMQGRLKTLSPENEQKLTRQIKKNGFSYPIAVWQDGDGKARILDGHQRATVLRKLRQAGWEIPSIPIVRVEAANEAKAREKLLAGASSFGKATAGGIYEFLELSGLDTDALEDTTMPMPKRAALDDLTEWDDSPLEMAAMFSFTAAIELQAKIRACLKKNFPTENFEESVV